MSYAKLVKVCRNYALGYQDVNQAIDNNDAMRVLYDAKHGTAEISANPWDVAGRHDDEHIARGLLRASVVSSGGVSYLDYVVSGTCIGSTINYGTGKWGVTIYGLGTFYAVAQVESSSTVRKAQAYIDRSSSWPQVIVTTHELGSGTFAPANVGFCLSVWGTPL